jgi:UDP-glucose 4-epimerase
MEQKLVITGGAGFIGSNLAEALAIANQVIVIDDLSTGIIENLRDVNVKFINGSILDSTLLRSSFEGVDCVFHQAADASVQRSIQDPIRSCKIGIEGTLNILKAASDSGVKRVVYASSGSVYGESQNLPFKENMCPNPKSPYAISKLVGEKHCEIFQELYGLETVSLRYFNVFGPKQSLSSEYSGVISKFILAAARGQRPVIYGDGEQTRDFVYVKDIVRANILASHSGSGVFNIAGGCQISLNCLIKKLSVIFKQSIIPDYTEPRLWDMRHGLADISKAKNIGYKPEFSLEKGLEETAEWLIRYV